MDLDTLGKKVGFDAYDIGARLRPAVFALFPIALTVMTVWPDIWTGLNPVLALAASVGGLTALTHFSRDAGKRVENRLGDRAGRKHSARLLSHGDDTLPRQSKERLHAYLAREGELDVPTVAFERSQPALAAEDYRALVKWLLEHTRPTAKDALIYKENIAYGFKRNARGLRPAGLAASTVAVVILGCAIAVPDMTPADRSAVVMPFFLACACLAWWAFVVRDAWVCAASSTYAERLLSAAERTIRTA